MKAASRRPRPADTPLKVTRTEDGVIAHRWMMDVEPAPFYKKIVEFEGNCDRLQHCEVRYPAHALIRAVFTRRAPVARRARWTSAPSWTATTS